MARTHRCSTDEVNVLGFAPSCQLPKSRPCSLDPFLHPLITDIEDTFINSKSTNFIWKIEVFSYHSNG